MIIETVSRDTVIQYPTIRHCAEVEQRPTKQPHEMHNTQHVRWLRPSVLAMTWRVLLYRCIARYSDAYNKYITFYILTCQLRINMKLLLIFVLSMACTYCIGQNPKDFHAFDNQKHLVLEDNFDNDERKWLEDSDDCETPIIQCFIVHDSSYIADGHLVINSASKQKNGFQSFSINTDVDFNKNFEIVFSAKISGAISSRNEALLYWGGGCNQINGHNFSFTNNRDFDIFYTNKQFERHIHPDVNKSLFCKKEVYKPNDYNSYTVRRFNKYYYMFLNGRYIGRCKYIPLPGRLIGFRKRSNNPGEFDFIKIYYLNDQ